MLKINHSKQNIIQNVFIFDKISCHRLRRRLPWNAKIKNMLSYNKYNTRIDTNIIQYSARSFLNFISNQNKIVKLNKRCFCKKKELPRTNCLIDFLKSFLTARTTLINCSRWNEIICSQDHFNTAQFIENKYLVR